MNYQGQPCKGCGEIIQVFSSSGYCRKCFHKKRGGKNYPGSKAVKILTKEEEK